MEIKLKSRNESECLIFTEKFKAVPDFLNSLLTSGKSIYYIVDSELLRFEEYKGMLEDRKKFVFDANETNKNIDTVLSIQDFLLKNSADRKSLVIGIGGGITLDITGFAASIFMRGIPFGFVPTTLLAMVDASIGGKNGVNFKGFKNYIGTFNNPDFILISTFFLKTLPRKEFNVGIAEVIKYGAIYKPELLDYLFSKFNELNPQNERTLSYIIEQSIKTKIEVVEKDFKESGLRKILNFGHTLGHALERLKMVSHGEGVAAGMVFASFLSLKKGYLSEYEFEKLLKIISLFNLPVFIKGVSIKDLLDGISGDKKKAGTKIDFVLLKGLGKPVIESMDLSEIRRGLEDLHKCYGN